jgi:phenylalanyl-tRNA synthetase, beta subunit, non-spirochete bacterial
MKLSRNFLNDYVDTKNIDNFELAEKMTSVGNEYESVEPLSSATNVVVGYVLECIDHPDSDHLHVCQVEIKPNETTQIVCGAPNVAKGQKVVVSLPGAILPGNFEIKKSVIRGQESNGMICALGELGIESKYQSEEDKAGIHVLQEDAPIGEDALVYLGYDDVTIDFELTSNKADLLSVIGMAYEVGAILDSKVNIKEDKISKEIEDINEYLSLDVKTDKCPLYLARMVKNVEVKESPNWLKSRLIASGVRPINNVVDISNYVMLEYGQPLHFFDYETLGKKIIVRMALEEEKMTTLDNQERALTSEDIVIANEKEAVCLAGVMGGLNSEVESTTKDVVIEAAIFNPTNIRLTSKKILRSEASNRFEKGLDPNRTYMAINRACYLLEKYAGATVIKGMLVSDNTNNLENKIEITTEKIVSVLGIEIGTKDIEEVFRRLDFKYEEKNNKFIVTIPTRRLDVIIPEDLIEEIGRIHGIDQIKGKLPKLEITPGKYDERYKTEKLLKRRLEALGLTEVITYTLTEKEKTNMFTNDSVNVYEMLNPMSEDRKYTRYSLLPSLMEVAEYNLSRQMQDIFVYEISKVYYKKDDKDIMESRLAGLLVGSTVSNKWANVNYEIDFYSVKGMIENILNYLGLSNRYSFDNENIPKEYHSYQTARILIDRKPIGYIGVVHPNVSKTKLCVFEINLDEIFKANVREIKNKEISKYPSVNKDLAFIMKKEMTSVEVENIIKKSAGRLLTDIEVFDVYAGNNLQEDEKSIAYALTFADSSKTLSDEEVNEIFNKVINDCESKLDIKLRSK